MRDFARRPQTDRRDLFGAAAEAMRVHPAIVEKDFWVCWTLDYLFHQSHWKEHLAFKGGTSLSKAYGAIERFSEDIDLILDWRLLGTTEAEMWGKRSPTQQARLGEDVILRSQKFLADELSPALRRDMSERAGVEIAVTPEGEEVRVRYPAAFSLATILPELRLEIGPLAAWVPSEAREIRPYAAERFPGPFTRPSTVVRTILAERTFWEKATILHREAHRAPDNPPPPRTARHYYDLFRLSRMPIRGRALERMDLLADVVRFKIRFYRCPWARYEDATPNRLRLLPTESHLKGLRLDYENTRALLFGTVPAFEEITGELLDLEETIHKLAGC